MTKGAEDELKAWDSAPAVFSARQEEMTNKEYITKTLNGLDVSEDDIDIILLKGSVDADAPADANMCDLAIYHKMSAVLKGMMQNVSEGGYSISWNMDAVKLFYAALCNELGVENVLVNRPKIRNRSNIW